MSSIDIRFEEWQEAEQLINAVNYAIDEKNSHFVLDDGTKMLGNWFRIGGNDISTFEAAMNCEDVEEAHSRLCDILINMIPSADFSSYASYQERIGGYEKVFHIVYKDGKKSGYDIEGIWGACCPVCEESLIHYQDYELKKTYTCSCGYEYDPLDENLEWGIVNIYDALKITDIPELKIKRHSKTDQTHSTAIVNSPIELSGKTFITTGLSEDDETWVKEQVEYKGGIVKRKFVVTLDYLIYNPDYDHETVKLKRAKEQKEKGKPVQIITFEQFKESL